MCPRDCEEILRETGVSTLKGFGNMEIKHMCLLWFSQSLIYKCNFESVK